MNNIDDIYEQDFADWDYSFGADADTFSTPEDNCAVYPAVVKRKAQKTLRQKKCGRHLGKSKKTAHRRRQRQRSYLW